MTDFNVEESSDSFVVELEDFSGPLDLLLHLIRQQEIDIADIPIAVIARQFLAAIGKMGLDQAADYLEMAALLLRIKVQMLLPRSIGSEEWEDPRAELVRRLLEYEQVKEVAYWMAGRAEYRSDRFSRGWIPPEPEPGPSPVSIDIQGVLQAIEEVIASIPEPIIHRVLARPLDIEGARKRIEEMIVTRSRFSFADVLGERPAIVDVLSALLAFLEMARVGTVRLVQEKPFSAFEISGETAYPTN